MQKTFTIILATILIHCSFIPAFSAKIFILVGPSGTGKSSLIQKIRDAGLEFKDLVSSTTRPPRAGEENGKDYFFLSSDEFAQKEAAGEFLTITSNYGNRYGIPKGFINEMLESNCSIFCCLVASTARQLQSMVPEQAVTIFVAPPSMEVLCQRLTDRNTEDAVALQKRLSSAAGEMMDQDSFDFKLVNDDLTRAAQELHDIFISETSQ